MQLQEFNGDQAREAANTDQRYGVVVQARRRAAAYRGSMSFAGRNGVEYLVRDYYDPLTGVRKQKSLGRRGVGTEQIAAEFASGKQEASARLKDGEETLKRQASVNRALKLGRVPELGARIIRAVDDAGLLGRGLRVVGTNALFAYEAAAGVHLEPELLTTEDIDILFDARRKLRLSLDEDVPNRSMIGLLKKVDSTFDKTTVDFQASNSKGYLVDLIRPVRNPPWLNGRGSVAVDHQDLSAVAIDGLVWPESAPAFESVAIDGKGFPVRIVAPDPRAFAVHKLWLSRRSDRNPLKRRRDEAQARAVANLVKGYLIHLPFEGAPLRSFPKSLVDAAAPLFE